MHFIIQEGCSAWFDTSLPLYHCEFNKQAYQDHLFGELGVPFSPTLDKAVIKRRAEFLAGRYCAAQALRKLGVMDLEIPIGRNRAPSWPEGIVGSISHCEGHAVAITSRREACLGVGIDIETIVGNETYGQIENQILSKEESIFVTQNQLPTNLLFTLLFSAKESFFKAAYPSVKRYFDFNAVSVISVDEKNQCLRFVINQDLNERLKKGTIFCASYRSLPNNKIVTLVYLPRNSKVFS